MPVCPRISKGTREPSCTSRNQLRTKSQPLTQPSTISRSSWDVHQEVYVGRGGFAPSCMLNVPQANRQHCPFKLKSAPIFFLINYTGTQTKWLDYKYLWHLHFKSSNCQCVFLRNKTVASQTTLGKRRLRYACTHQHAPGLYQKQSEPRGRGAGG